MLIRTFGHILSLTLNKKSLKSQQSGRKAKKRIFLAQVSQYTHPKSPITRRLILETTNELERPATSTHADALLKHGYIDKFGHFRALTLLKQRPSASEWMLFIDKFLLFLGAALALSGTIFFFAYNWKGLHKFGKLGLLQAGVLGLALLAWNRGLEKLSGKMALMSSAVLVGGLLAVYGQIYQTGADPYQLFMGWFVFILGWVWLSKFPPLWIFWLLLVNITIPLYIEQGTNYSFSYILPALPLFAVNFAALLLWELGSKTQAWMNTPAKWMQRALYMAAGLPLFFSAFSITVDKYSKDASNLLIYLLYFGFIAFTVWHYTKKRFDLLKLAVQALGFIILSTGFLVRYSSFRDIGAFFFIGGFVVVEVVIAVYILRYFDNKNSALLQQKQIATVENSETQEVENNG